MVGNLHAAGWPLGLFEPLRRQAVVVGFMHDCYLVSGRCAYPGDCRLYETGCDESCPTPDEYPALAPAKIPGAWRYRRELFCGAEGVPLAANSSWTLQMARRSLAGLRFADTVYYGLDARLFKPIDRKLARRLVGVAEDRFVILGGAVNMAEPLSICVANGKFRPAGGESCPMFLYLPRHHRVMAGHVFHVGRL